ncbi:MAG: nuclear transport factor 2 family protein [Phycisphaeraceae bacterium]
MTTATDTASVAQKLTDLCAKGEFMTAIETLFSQDAESVEAMAMPGMEQTTKGLEKIKGKNQWWMENHEVHGFEIKGPFPHGDRFALLIKIDVTAKAGPQAGQRTEMEEVCLYTVKNGKIVKEEFFYGQ